MFNRSYRFTHVARLRTVHWVGLGATWLATVVPSLVAAQPSAPQDTSQAPPVAPAPADQAPPKVSRAALDLEVKLQTMLRGDGLVSDTVATRAVRNSSLVEAKHQALLALDEDVSQARAAFIPSLNLSARYTRLSDVPQTSLGDFGQGSLIVSADPSTAPRPVAADEPLLAVPAPNFSFPVFLNQYVLSAQLNVPLSDYVLRTSQAVRAVKRSREGALHTENATIRSVARDSKVVYYQWIRAQGVLLVARQATEQARGHHQDSMYAFSAGTASKADVLRAEGQLRSAELFESRAASHVKLLASQLSVMMGDPPGTHYEVGENILAPLPEPRHEADERAAYEEALAQRLEFKALQASEDALRDQATLVRVGGYPRLDAQANAQYSNPNPRIFPQQDRFDGSWDVGVVLSWTPTALFGTEAQSDGFVARANELSAQRRQMQEALRLELVRVQSALSDARTATVSAQQILAAAEEGYRVRRELFRVGRATAVEVTDAETELMRARLELVNAHVDLRIARVEFDHVLGRGPAP